jgi:hypothetical protein
LGFLEVAPDRITMPLLAAVYRAPFGGADFSLFLTVRAGTFKTALAALCQQHFGANLDANRLPGHFASTVNALEQLAFHGKDALIVIDDFAPKTALVIAPSRRRLNVCSALPVTAKAVLIRFCI